MRWAMFLVFAMGCGGATTDTPSNGDPGQPGVTPVVDETCLGGAGASFVLADSSTNGLFVDASYVYTASIEGIVRVPRAGGAAELLDSDDRSPRLVALDSDALYYFGELGSKPSLFSLPLAGGKPHVLATGFFGVTTGAIVDSMLSWTDGTAVEQVAITGGTPSAIAKLPSGVSALELQRGPTAYYVSGYEAQIENHIDVGHGTIFTVPFDGGAPTALVENLRQARSLSFDGDRLYFLQERHLEQPGFISTARLDGTDLHTVVDAVDATSVAVDAHALYFTTNDAVMKVAKTGGTPAVVAAGLQGPANLHIYGGNLYWEAAVNVALSSTAPHGIMTVCK